MAVPRRLEIPRNLFFTGTVNIDETTHMFSPKVLDRAFTLELNEVDLKGYGGKGDRMSSDPLWLTKLPETLSFGELPNAQDWKDFGALEKGDLRGVVTRLHDLLAAHNRHFGYRVANEIARFVCLAQEQAGAVPATLWAALDLALLQKVLPKFHGTQQELQKPLEEILAFARSRVDEPPAIGLPRLVAKVERMLKRLHDQGFTSYIE